MQVVVELLGRESQDAKCACCSIALSIGEKSFGGFDRDMKRMCNKSVLKFQLVVEHRRDEKATEQRQSWFIPFLATVK